MIKYLFLLTFAFSLFGCGIEKPSTIELEVGFISNLGPEPIFSWKAMEGTERKAQLAYQLLVSDDPSLSTKLSGTVWDSEIVQGSSSLQLRYDGPELKAGKKYYAIVKTWDRQGGQSNWSEVVDFIVPLDNPENWKAQWLTYDYKEDAPLPIFRKPFEVKNLKEIDYALFYIAAPGYYEASLNGLKMGENVLDPGQTNYEDYTYYTAYEIDPQHLNSENVLGVMLGNGWYNQNQVWKGQAEYSIMVYGQPVFLAQLVIHRKDGSIEVIASDESWKWAQGPITYSNVYGGEHYDARLELENWNTHGDPQGEWFAPQSPEIHPTRLLEQFAEPIQMMDEIEVKEITEREDGSYIFDFGQNMAGWMELKIEGDPGQEITIQCTEILDKDGNLDPFTTGVQATGVVQTQKYICKGEGVEIWRPRFTYFGFRYAQVSGLREAPGQDLLSAQVIYSSVKDVGVFTCSEPNINKLNELSRWTIIGNIHNIPTDCPHREKCGWTGDSHAMIQPMIYNLDAQRFFEKYMFDMRSSGREEKVELYFGRDFHDRSMVTKPAGVPTMIVPGKRTSGCATPDWGTALVQIPWYLYLYYGDRLMLEYFYPDMKVWVEYIEGMKEDGIIPHGLGDWCPPGGNSNIDCPVSFSSSAFHILDVSIMVQVSGMMGRSEERNHYSELLDQLKLDFNRHFFNPKTGSYGTSQTANVMALDLGIVPADEENKVAFAIVKNIREEYDGFLNTGIFGLARVFKVLSENGYESEVYRLLTKSGDNSFAYMWEGFDATTLWEQLPTREEFGSTYRSSMNHPMQAGFDAWFYSGIAGINPTSEAPGFQRIIFKPYLTRQMDSASASYESKSGHISSSWERKGDSFTWKISIPANSKGLIYMPTYGSKGNIHVNGERFEAAKEERGFSLIGEYGPGEYLVELS
jgi:alpha-L-rhamnosidase